MIKDLKIKIFADGADKKSMVELAKKDWCAGCTTNPTLLRKAGVVDYKAFALDVLSEIKDKPVSFEVFSDEFSEMRRQALEISSWSQNVNVKIPITNTRGESSIPLVQELSHAGVKLNVTAVFTLEQVLQAAQALKGGAPGIISVFAGRIADSGRCPKPIMAAALAICQAADPNIELLWASPRQIFDAVLANEIGCHIITISHDILAKIDSLGKDLTEFSLDTVKMFYKDAVAAGYTL